MLIIITTTDGDKVAINLNEISAIKDMSTPERDLTWIFTDKGEHWYEIDEKFANAIATLNAHGVDVTII